MMDENLILFIFPLICSVISFYACFRGHYIFARYYHDNQIKDFVLLSIIAFSIWIFIFSNSEVEKGGFIISTLFIMIPYPYCFAQFLRHYNKNVSTLMYSIPMIIIHVWAWLYIVGYNIRIV